MKDKYNEKILENVKQKISISNFMEEENRKMNKKNKNIVKYLAVACCMLFSVTGVIFAKDIGIFIKNKFGPNTSDGVDDAINNGYIANTQVEYQNGEGIKISVESFLMDDFNFAMNFSVVFDESHNINETTEFFEFDDLKITDESGKIVFVTHKANSNLEYKGGYSVQFNKKTDAEFIVSLSATGNPEPFPRSNHLTVTFSKIKLTNYSSEQIYTGNWKFEIDVPEEFYNRECLIYNVKSCNDENTTVTKAILSSTALKIALTTTSEKIDYEKLHGYSETSIYDKSALQKEYVETSSGKRFEPAGRSDGDGGYGLSSNNVIEYYQTFNLTKYDATDNITVHIFTNKGEEIIIELEKAK